MAAILVQAGLVLSFIGAVLLAGSFLRPNVKRTWIRALNLPFDFIRQPAVAAREEPVLVGWFFFATIFGSALGFAIAYSGLPFENAGPEVTDTQARIQFTVAFWLGLLGLLASTYFLLRRDGPHPFRRILLLLPGTFGFLVWTLYFGLGLAALAVGLPIVGAGWYVGRKLANLTGLKDSAPGVGALLVAVGTLLQLVDALFR